MEKALLSCIIKKNADSTYTFIGSDETIDRDGEIIKVDGWQLANYRKNPVILWGHNHTIPAIGKAERVYKSDGKLMFKVRFAKPGTYDLADTVRALVDDGILKSVSVGYNPIARDYPSDNEKGSPRVVTTKAELYELSIVNVPANQNALLAAMKEKGYSEKQIKMISSDEEKSVIPYKQTPKAPEDASWDAAAEIKAASVDDLKIMCTWYDKENADNKSSYKLPHHTAKGHKVVWKGVAAAMAALLGARGGVAIPSADRKGVYNHLVKHYKEFDKEPPDFKELDEIEVKEDTEIKEMKEMIEEISEKLDEVLEKISIEKSKPKYDDLLKGQRADQPSRKPNRSDILAEPIKKYFEDGGL